MKIILRPRPVLRIT